MPTCELCSAQVPRRNKIIIMAERLRNNPTAQPSVKANYDKIIKEQKDFIMACLKCASDVAHKRSPVNSSTSSSGKHTSAACYMCAQAVSAKRQLRLEKFAREKNATYLMLDCQECNSSEPDYIVTTKLLKLYVDRKNGSNSAQKKK
jgi:hypothetical protein